MRKANFKKAEGKKEERLYWEVKRAGSRRRVFSVEGHCLINADLKRAAS